MTSALGDVAKLRQDDGMCIEEASPFEMICQLKLGNVKSIV
jgi:hypothetical protein